jgi:hypothetical protein
MRVVEWQKEPSFGGLFTVMIELSRVAYLGEMEVTMRKTLSCGHKGKDGFCRRCGDEAALERQCAGARESAREMVRNERLTKVTSAPIDLTLVEHLPVVLDRALELLGRLTAGAHPLALKGKLLRSLEGEVYSIPVGLRFRMLVERRGYKPVRLLTHGTYNASCRTYVRGSRR